MTFEMKDLPQLIAAGARRAHQLTRADDQSFEEWVFALEEKNGWDAVNEIASMAARALSAEATTVQDELAIRVMQAASFGFVALMSDALIATTAAEGLV